MYKGTTVKYFAVTCSVNVSIECVIQNTNFRKQYARPSLQTSTFKILIMRFYIRLGRSENVIIVVKTSTRRCSLYIYNMIESRLKQNHKTRGTSNKLTKKYRT